MLFHRIEVTRDPDALDQVSFFLLVDGEEVQLQHQRCDAGTWACENFPGVPVWGYTRYTSDKVRLQ